MIYPPPCSSWAALDKMGTAITGLFLFLIRIAQRSTAARATWRERTSSHYIWLLGADAYSRYIHLYIYIYVYTSCIVYMKRGYVEKDGEELIRAPFEPSISAAWTLRVAASRRSTLFLHESFPSPVFCFFFFFVSFRVLLALLPVFFVFGE